MLKTETSITKVLKWTTVNILEINVKKNQEKNKMEGIKKKSMEILEQNYTITEIKISLDRNNSKMEKRQRKKISELEHRVLAIIQSE